MRIDRAPHASDCMMPPTPNTWKQLRSRCTRAVSSVWPSATYLATSNSRLVAGAGIFAEHPPPERNAQAKLLQTATQQRNRRCLLLSVCGGKTPPYPARRVRRRTGSTDQSPPAFLCRSKPLLQPKVAKQPRSTDDCAEKNRRSILE